MLPIQMGCQHRIEIGRGKAGIFKDPEQQQIAGDANRENGKAQAGMQLPRDQEIADAVIEGDRAQQQQHELPAAEGVESQ